MTPPPADAGEAEAVIGSDGSISGAAVSIEVSRHILCRILSDLVSSKASLYFESTTLSLLRSFLSSSVTDSTSMVELLSN